MIKSKNSKSARIIIASKNTGKVGEIKTILSLENVEFLDLLGLSFTDRIEERGKTFEENALIKARTVFERYKIPVVADDSGLSVFYLDGEPGVLSSRFAKDNATDEENNKLLLEKLEGVPDELRSARFLCVACFYYDVGKYFLTEGKIEGIIANVPKGKNGFGYDPLFFLPAYNKTMAQLSDEQKNSISHRAQSFGKLKRFIEGYFRDLQQ